MTRRQLALLLAALPAASQNSNQDDPLLKALRDELARARTIKLPESDPPYYIEYGIDDLQSFSVTAVLGGIVNSNADRNRIPRLHVRVGSPEFDNTNYVYSDFFVNRLGGARIPLDNDINVIRHGFWLATDRAYKGAVEAIARKRAALRNVTQQEKLNDFAKADPVKLILPATKVERSLDDWTGVARRVSAVFSQFPKITNSSVQCDAGYTVSYYVNTEGSEIRYPDDLFYVRIRGFGETADGMPIRDSATLMARTVAQLPGDAELERAAREIGQNVTALLDAPIGEDYSGPVVMEGVAAAQMFAQLIGSNLALPRRPVSEPGRNFPLPESELEGRLNARLLPDWMDVIDDPTQEAFEGRQLQGTYRVDMDGVVPQPLTVVEKGVFKNFLRTRQPVKGFEGSNGRARLPGPFGANAAVFSNLFVRASNTVAPEELKKKLIEMATQRGKPYGVLIRKLDYPTAASIDELRRLASSRGQRGGDRIPALPLMAYRVYPDGREELVRGWKFRSLNVRILRDILAASNKTTQFNFIGSGSYLPALEPSGYVAGHSVVAPSFLIEELELEKREEDWPKAPVVPPPPLTSSR